MIKLEDWEKDKVPAGAVVSRRTSRAAAPDAKFYAGEPILEQKLFGKGAGERSDEPDPQGLSRRLGPGRSGDDPHGLVLPGSRVDLQLYVPAQPGNGHLGNQHQNDPPGHQGLCRQRRVRAGCDRPGDQVDPGDARSRCWSRPPGGEGDAWPARWA